METNSDENSSNKKLLNFYNNNKLKIYSILSILIITLILYSLFKISVEKKNNLIAEKYIQAGVYLSSNKKEESKKLFEEVILSKNNFYSILALNTMLDSDLILDEKKVLEYFEKVEKYNKSKDQKDLIIFKKALFLIKNSENQKGENLLKKLISKNSILKPISQELLGK